MCWHNSHTYLILLVPPFTQVKYVWRTLCLFRAKLTVCFSPSAVSIHSIYIYRSLTQFYTINGMYIRWQTACIGEVLACDHKEHYSNILWKIESPCAFLQNKWCHSTHLKLNNRSDGSSVHRTDAVRVITKSMSGALTQPYQSLYQSGVSQTHTTLGGWDDVASHGLKNKSQNVQPAHFGLLKTLFVSWEDILGVCVAVAITKPGSVPLGIVFGNGAGESATCWLLMVLHQRGNLNNVSAVLKGAEILHSVNHFYLIYKALFLSSSSGLIHADRQHCCLLYITAQGENGSFYRYELHVMKI